MAGSRVRSDPSRSEGRSRRAIAVLVHVEFYVVDLPDERSGDIDDLAVEQVEFDRSGSESGPFIVQFP